jgi:eukaryotic-like serine/threonine-protein kinase
MSDTQLSEAEKIFADAVDLDPGDRGTVLHARCRGDAALLAEVERLLAAADASKGYFDELPARLGIDRLRQGSAGAYQAHAGQQFGKYRLTRLVGEGGMGAVWCAERADGRFEGEVAVKLLTRSRSGAALERFDREARYLARLKHPNIARLIDAGIGPDDVPYLILEYVEGERIDRWCDARRLEIDARLGLFMRVADAVAHAHTQLIVHSDIKPSNVLVTADGTVKLLDFGIATLLDGEADALAGYALTPEFAAPEQLAGERVSTATDVYSLGLLLHTLLTGASPRQLTGTTSLEALRRAAMRQPAPLASTIDDAGAPAGANARQIASARKTSPDRLRKTLRGELDPVVRKALAVEASERYANVADFAADVAHYRRNEPVAALPGTMGYRTRKFVQRHRGSVLTASLTTLALLAAVAVTTWQSIEAARQRDAAIKQQERVLATNDFLNMLLDEVGPTGQLPSKEALIDRGVEIIESQYGKNERTTAMTFFELSVLYGRMGLLEKQIATLDRSEATARTVGDDGMLASALCAKARLKMEHDPDASAADLVAGNAALARLAGAERSTITECYRAEALMYSVNGDHDGAIEVYRTALDVLDEAPVQSPALRLMFLNDLGEQYYLTGRAGQALEILEETIRYQEELGRGTTLTQIIYLSNRAAVLSRLGEVRRAAEQQADIVARVAGLRQAPIGLGVVYAANLLRLGRYEEAAKWLEEDYAAAEQAGNERRKAIAAELLAEAKLRGGDDEAAAQLLDIAAATFATAPGAYRRNIVRLTQLLGELDQRRGDPAAAQRRSEELLESLGYPDDLSATALHEALWYAAELAQAGERPGDALALAESELAIVSGVARDSTQSADVGRALHQRAKARLALGQTEAAYDDLRAALVALRNGFGAEHAETRAVAALLAAGP